MSQKEQMLHDDIQGLTEFEYQSQRKELAKKHEVQVAYVDKLYKALHPNEQSGSGTELLFEEVLPGEEPVDGAKLLETLKDSVQRYVILPEGGAEICALWTLFAWSHDSFDVSPILAIQSPQKGSGKTTLLDWFTRVLPRPLPTSHATTAAIFRAIEKWHPTMLVDEADAFLKNNEDLRAILNSGHLRTSARVLRTVDTGDGPEVRGFSSWSPKAIAGIGTMSDTLQDRSIILLLKRRRIDEPVERLKHGKDNNYFYSIRRDAAGFAFQNETVLHEHDPTLPEGLSNRQGDNWTPLICIADIAGGHWPDTVRGIALKQTGNKEDTDYRTLLLQDIKYIFEEYSSLDRISSKTLIHRLTSNDDAPWGEWKRGNPISPRQLAGLLKPYGIASEKIWVDGQQAKGYKKTDFSESWERYLAHSTPQQMGTKVQNSDNALTEKQLAEYPNGTGTDVRGTGEQAGTFIKGTVTQEGTALKNGISFPNKKLIVNRYLCTANVTGATEQKSILPSYWDTHDPDGNDGGMALF